MNREKRYQITKERNESDMICEKIIDTKPTDKEIIEKTDKKYTAEEIREAVDIATGDDGFRGKEVISILETNVKQNTEEYLKERITKNDN
jgi:hypothetical protein